MTWQGGVGLLYLLMPVPLLLAFMPPGGAAQELLRGGATMLAISGVWQAFDALGLTFGEALRGAGDTAWCMWARIVVAWVLFMPVAYVAVNVWRGGPTAALWSIVVYIVCLAALLVWRFRSGAWKRIQLTEPEVVV